MGVYGIPYESLCDNQVDDDGDGDIDCADSDCIDNGACVDLPVYGVPLLEEVCANQVDDDGDELIDCDDPDCSEDPECYPPATRYGIPF